MTQKIYSVPSYWKDFKKKSSEHVLSIYSDWGVYKTEKNAIGLPKREETCLHNQLIEISILIGDFSARQEDKQDTFYCFLLEGKNSLQHTV